MRLFRLNIALTLLRLARIAFPGETEHGPIEQRWTCTDISRAGRYTRVHAREGVSHE